LRSLSIAVGKPSLDWTALIGREKAMIRHIPASLGELMNRRGVEVIHDRGRFADRNAVAVNGETLEAKHIVISTGSKPRKLPFPTPATSTSNGESAPSCRYSCGWMCPTFRWANIGSPLPTGRIYSTCSPAASRYFGASAELKISLLLH
jgi:hypothetical protein